MNTYRKSKNFTLRVQASNLLQVGNHYRKKKFTSRYFLCHVDVVIYKKTSVD